jgi:transposase InsO family protein
MLTETQLHHYFELHQLLPDAISYITQIRETEPSRMVGTHARKNLCSWFYSDKMQRTLSTESRTAERAFAVLCEFDSGVLEIWDQPEPVNVLKYTKKGIRRRSWYNPDFLLLHKDGPIVVEVKAADDASDLVALEPMNWRKDEDGSYDFLPAKEYFASIGLRFQVFVASQDQRFRVFNQDLILRARHIETPAITERDLEKVFEESFCWSLYELRIRLKLNDYTALIQCIDRGSLFFDWDKEMLSEPRGCYVVRRKELLQYVADFRGPKIYHDSLLSPIDVERMPSSAYAEEALERLKRIEMGEKGRSVRRWRVMVERGSYDGWSAFQSLIPKWFFSGNRNRRVNELVDAFLLKYLLEEHAVSQGLTDYRSYIRYRVKAQAEHPAYPPVTRTTFLRRLRAIPPEQIAMLRGGKRKANAAAEPSDPEQRQLKAELAWQRVAVDHHLAEIYLVFFASDNCPYAMKPWLTAMIDLATGCILAFSVSFQNPSRRSVAKVMRDCVRRHGLLPREIVVDRGPDFRSVYFSSLLAHSKIELVLRPASHSRYGGEVEALFREFQVQWLTQRQGNSTDYKNARGVDGKLAPKNLAVLTPHDFYREFEAFISWRDSNPKGTSLLSPKLALSCHMREYPFVAIRQAYNDEYALATAVDTTNYTLDFQRGIHIGPMWYWSPHLAQLRGKKSSLEVRIDPENPHAVYGLIGNRWVPCYSSRINRYAALDPISQWVDGLIAIDAFNARQKVKQQADEEVVKIIRDMTDNSRQNKNSQVAMLTVSEDSGDLEEESIFSLLKGADIQSLETETWEAQYAWER